MTAAHPALDRVHMIGIGGAGMSGLARILLERGSVVTGSDRAASANVESLRTRGALISVGHAAENLELSGQLPTAVVTSFAAIPKDNPELVRARELSIPLLRRSDLLALLMEGHKQVLIAGTHGKTSTTSIIATAMIHAGLNPSYAIGGQLSATGVNAQHGSGDAFIAEADESDASLLSYRPDIAVITNIEPDHLDYFHTPEAYFQVFDDFADRVTDTGSLVICLDDDHAAALGERAAARGINVVGYGSAKAASAHPDLNPRSVVTATEVVSEGTRVEVAIDGRQVTYICRIPGQHMVLNSAAGLLAGVLAGGTPGAIAEGISSFGGVRRRFEYYGEVTDGPLKGVSVYDDYAHHPTEVAAVLSAARERTHNRVIAVFQPHLFTRTQEFSAKFAKAFELADIFIGLDIYPGRETPIEGVTTRLISDAIGGDTQVFTESSFVAVPPQVVELAQPGDLVITVGAGNVTELAPKIFEALREASHE